MSDLDALLAGIVADPHNQLRWLIVADWLDDHEQCDRAELLRLHRELIRTCHEPDAHSERAQWQRRVVELIDLGVKPCVPQHTLMLPGGVPLVGNFIPPGSFLMGDEEEAPVHEVTLTNGLFLGISPVTQDQWVAMMWENPSRFEGNTLPVELVTWDDAARFCGKVSAMPGTVARLPTEAEWEYACRAGTTTRYHWGDRSEAKRMNDSVRATWDASNDEYQPATKPAGTFGANPWGLFDCHGNVWEWCADWYDAGYYGRSPAVDPECEDGTRTHCVLRGGSWFDHPRNCGAACRHCGIPDGCDGRVGFRVAFTLS